MNQTPLELSDDFKFALETLEKSNAHLFITGKAGTGKSTLLQLFRNTTRKKTVVLAPTGVAALNVRGQTIHSFFGFPARPLSKSEIYPRKDKRIFKQVELIIIDEISMVRADLLDNIDYFLQINRGNNQLFGGVQMVFFGDLFQLPPVVSSEEEKKYFSSYYVSPYFFSARVFDTGFQMELLELRKVYRQESRHFLRLLDSVRLGVTDMEDLEDFNARYRPNFPTKDFYITLSPRNMLVDQLNNQKLMELSAEEFTFNAEITGLFDLKQFPTDFSLKLRNGAQVMFLKNDPEGAYVNGTIGKVIDLSFDKIVVETVDDYLESKKLITLTPYTWEILKYTLTDDNKIDTSVIGAFKQFPLRLAWAITIHKSQGKTFDRVIIDMGRGGAFEFGQTYVALSRCRTLEGIVLKQPLSLRDIHVDNRVLEYYDKLKNE